MSLVNARKKNRVSRRNRSKTNVRSNMDRHRVVVYKTAKHLYAHAIDPITNQAVCGVASTEKKLKESFEKIKPVEQAVQIGEKFSAILKEKKIQKIVFDRNGFKYHGRIKAFADSLRNQGIEF